MATVTISQRKLTELKTLLLLMMFFPPAESRGERREDQTVGGV